MMKEISKKIGGDAEDKFWIGLNDIVNEDIWHWVDDTPLIEKYKYVCYFYPKYL